MNPTPSPPRRRWRYGMVAVLVAVCLVAIFSVIALVLDGGLLLEERRRAQAAADAAALAAATELFMNYLQQHGVDTGPAAARALAAAANNGYTNDGTDSIVTVHIPPHSGDHVGQPGYAEVIIQSNHPRFFSLLLGSGRIPIRARAVAHGRNEAFAAGILVLDLTRRASLNSHGNGTVTVTGASVIVNSSDPSAANAAGANARLIAPGGFYINGTYSGSTGPVGSECQFQGPVHTGVPPTADHTIARVVVQTTPGGPCK